MFHNIDFNYRTDSTGSFYRYDETKSEQSEDSQAEDKFGGGRALFDLIQIFLISGLIITCL